MTPLTRDVFDGATAERRLAGYFGLSTTEGFGALSRLELTAAAACISYVERTQLGQRPPLSPPVREAQGATLLIDQATRINLELARTLSGERRGSLLAAIDRTVTAAGSRLLAQRLAAPLTDPEAIARRHDAVEFFVTDTAARAGMRARLEAAPDLARALARLVVDRGGPRDLAAIRDGIAAAAGIATELTKTANHTAGLGQAATALRRPDAAITAELTAALADELPHLKRDGGFVRAGYDAALDEARALRDESRRVIAALQARYADDHVREGAEDPAQQRAGIFRRGDGAARRQVHGAAAQRDLHPPPDAGGTGALHHLELGELEAKIASAADRALGIELETFEKLTGMVTAAAADIKAAAEALAVLDVATALAQLAVERRYVRPEIDGSLDFVIEGGRHPVVEQALAGDGGPFVANDCDLSPPPQADGRPHLSPHRAEHGGQVDLSAPERAHCDPGADGELRSGAARQDRRGRPAVLARRRGRRHRARALDLHGRDGGDRGDSQSGGSRAHW